MTFQDHQFQKGREKTPGSGRKIGVRNKLSDKFLKDLHAEWERSGEAALKILAKEDPASFAKLALGVLPKELDHDGLPPVIVVNTGVDRGPSALPAPPAALPPPKAKEPEAVPCPMTSADEVAELPKAPEPAKAEPPKLERLIYPKIVTPDRLALISDFLCALFSWLLPARHLARRS
jgi:hypothetical protein